MLWLKRKIFEFLLYKAKSFHYLAGRQEMVKKKIEVGILPNPFMKRRKAACLETIASSG